MENQETNSQPQETFEQRLSQTRHEIAEFIQLADGGGYRAYPFRYAYRYDEDKKSITFETDHESADVAYISINTTEEDGRNSELTYHFFEGIPFKSSFNGIEQQEDVPLAVQDLEDIHTLIEYVNEQNKVNKFERDRTQFLKQLSLKALALDRAEYDVQRLLKDSNRDVIDYLARMSEEELEALVIQAVTRYGAGEMYAQERYLLKVTMKTLHETFSAGMVAESDDSEASDTKTEAGVVDKLLAERARESDNEHVRRTADLVSQLGFQGLKDAVNELEVLKADVTERAKRIRLPVPSMDMSAVELDGLYNQAAAVVLDRLLNNPDDYSQRNSLIGFANEMTDLFNWSRADVETAMSRIRADGSLTQHGYKMDIGLMQLVRLDQVL